MHSYDARRPASPVSSASQATHGVVSSSTSGRDDHSPIPQCSSSSYPCHTFQGGDEIENSEESEYFSPSTPGGSNGANYRYQRTSTPNGRERKRVLR